MDPDAKRDAWLRIWNHFFNHRRGPMGYSGVLVECPLSPLEYPIEYPWSTPGVPMEHPWSTPRRMAAHGEHFLTTGGGAGLLVSTRREPFSLRVARTKSLTFSLKYPTGPKGQP
jgi:hypothetical protein